MKTKRFDIISKWKIWFAIPVIILLFTLIMFGVFAGVNKDASRGIAIGVEFQGGSLLTLKLNQDGIGSKYAENTAKVENIIKNNKGVMNYTQKSGADSIIFKYALPHSLTQDELISLNDKIKEEIKNELSVSYPSLADPNAISSKFIGPSASSRLINTAIISVIISTLLILLYIMFRFELFSAIGAVAALVLDVLTMFCMMIVFHVQINSTFIAAMITIVAYSINNTIVIFDRVRENYKILDVKKYDDRFIVNKSVRDTLARSFVTTATTLFAIVILAIIGVSAIKEFALPVVFGLISGLFTSVCIAPSLYCLLKEKQIKKRGDIALGFKTK